MFARLASSSRAEEGGMLRGRNGRYKFGELFWRQELRVQAFGARQVPLAAFVKLVGSLREEYGHRKGESPDSVFNRDLQSHLLG